VINGNQKIKSTRITNRRKGVLEAMSFQDVSAEQLAELFHHYHQALGPDFGCAGKPIRATWQEVSQQEKSRIPTAGMRTPASISLWLAKRNGAAKSGSRQSEEKTFMTFLCTLYRRFTEICVQ
jgi:hypothetical protein